MQQSMHSDADKDPEEVDTHKDPEEVDMHKELEEADIYKDCQDSLLVFSSKGLNSGLELEVIDKQEEVGKSEEEDAEEKRD